MKQIPLAEFHAELKAQGVSEHEHFAFRCPCCGRIQSARSLIDAGAGDSFDAVEKYLGYSCVGRFTKAGPYKPGKNGSFPAPSRIDGPGCDWTLGGLFTLHLLEVVTEDGEKHPRFEPATPAEAQALEALHPKAVAA